MFNKAPFEGMNPGLQEQIIEEAKKELYPVLHKEDHWIIDYVRIRIRARKL